MGKTGWKRWTVFFLLLGLVLVIWEGGKAPGLHKPLPAEKPENQGVMVVEKSRKGYGHKVEEGGATRGKGGKVPADVIPEYEEKSGYEIYAGLYDFKTGSYWGYKDEEPFYPASLTKPLYLAALFRKAEEGKISLEDKYIFKEEDKYIGGALVGGSGVLQYAPPGKAYSYWQLGRLMITESDNIAANIILNRVGREEVNRYIREIGLKDTFIYRQYYEFDADCPSNRSTARDLTWFLVKMAEGAEKGDEKARAVIDIMQANPDKRIGRCALSRFKVANKTGTAGGMAGDMALIYTPEGEKRMALTVIVRAEGEKAVDIREGEEIIAAVARELLME